EIAGEVAGGQVAQRQRERTAPQAVGVRDRRAGRALGRGGAVQQEGGLHNLALVARVEYVLERATALARIQRVEVDAVQRDQAVAFGQPGVQGGPAAAGERGARIDREIPQREEAQERLLPAQRGA